MRLLYEDELVEAVVLSAASRKNGHPPDLQVRRFHAERERCYTLPDPDQRAAAFARVHLDWFVEWGLAEQLKALTHPFPELSRALEVLAFRQIRRRSEEGAELYGDAAGGRRAVLAIHPDRFRHPSRMTGFAHHELAHVADMLDPAFGYDPDLGSAGITASQQRLVVARYRLLWSVSIDGRLLLRGLTPLANKEKWQADFDRAFAFIPVTRRAESFEAFWTAEVRGHEELLKLASNPRGLGHLDSAVPGALCPLCGFAAFDWRQVASLSDEVRLRIQAEFPHWSTAGAVCARCAEMYEAVVGQRYPATVCL